MSREAREHRYQLEVRGRLLLPEPRDSIHLRTLLLPREGAGQRVVNSSLEITPRPEDFSVHVDLGGHTAVHSRIAERTDHVGIHGKAEVIAPRRPARLSSGADKPWELAVAAVRRARATGRADQGESAHAIIGIVEAALPSRYVDDGDLIEEYARLSGAPGLSAVGTALDLARRIRQDITPLAAQDLDAEAETTIASQVLATGTGDAVGAAHLLCAALRSLGLSARFVSGYLAPGGEDAARLHAWAAVWIPGGGWIPIDPARGEFADDRYLTVAWGRDIGDVAPIQLPGGRAQSSLSVSLHEI